MGRLPDVFGAHVVDQHAGMIVLGWVLHLAAGYIPSSPPGVVAVGPNMILVSGVHHVVASAGPEHLTVSSQAGCCVGRRLV